MTSNIELDENVEQFLIELFNQTKGDTSVNVSMFDIGAVLGMDKNSSSRAAEILIGWELAEVRTLSGAIGITDEGLKEARKRGAIGTASDSSTFKLGNDPIIDDAGQKMIEQIVTELKSKSSKMGLDFDQLTELIADLKTIDTQLTSSRPKTAIIRECFRSVKDILEKAGANENVAQIAGLL